MNKTKWKPAGWVGQPDYCGRCTEHPKSCYICTAGVEWGASAMLSALIARLMSPCTHGIYSQPQHKCTDCMAELKGEK